MVLATEDIHPLSKGVAVVKWKHFFDREIGGVGQSKEQRMAGLVRAGATEDSLKRFWNETKHLSWPATWGESPWETASMVGAALVAEERDPASRSANREYIEPFRHAVQGRLPVVRDVSASLNCRYAESVIGDRSRSYDAIEIQGVREIIDPVDQNASCCEVDNDNPAFFSVYVHHCTGGVACVGDLGTHALAREYADELSRTYGWPISDYVSEASATDDTAKRLSPARVRM